MLIAALAAHCITFLPSQVVIVLDPGHPSEVGRGTKGKYITEIDAAWQVSQELSKPLAPKR